MGSIARAFPKKAILATAFQQTNAGDLNRIFPGRSATTHLFNTLHRIQCCSSPYYVPEKKKKKKDGEQKDGKNGEIADEATESKMVEDSLDFEMAAEAEDAYAGEPQKIHTMKRLGWKYEKCPFEDIEIIVIEEGSTQYSELNGPLLAAACLCGKPKLVIMLGDYRQMPGMRYGNILNDFTKVSQMLDMHVGFHHNHRVSLGSELLKNNTEAIARRDPNAIRFDDKTFVNIPIKYTFRSLDAKAVEDVCKSVVEVLRSNQITEYGHHIITRTNKIRRAIQFAVEEYYHKKSYGENSPYRKNCYWVGRKIYFSQGDPDIGIASNEIFTLSKIVDICVLEFANGKKKTEKKTQQNTSNRLEDGWSRKIYVKRIEEDREIEVDWEWAEQFIERASATTVRKFQGSQKKIIIYVKPYHTRYDTNEDAYTAFSRSMEVAYFIGDKDDLKKSILNPEPTRRSNLYELIFQRCEKFKTAYMTPNMDYVEELAAKEEEEHKQREKEKRTVKSTAIFSPTKKTLKRTTSNDNDTENNVENGVKTKKPKKENKAEPQTPITTKKRKPKDTEEPTQKKSKKEKKDNTQKPISSFLNVI